MSDRLSSLDVSFLYVEGRTTPMHVGGLAVFEPPEDGFDYDRMVELIQERISLVPRYRQKIKWVPGNLASPVWVDDSEFDISYHVRRSVLPKPGSERQLLELVARLQARHLERNRPLWEMNIVEGLANDRIAVVSKTHHALVDGLSAIDLVQVILDVSPEPRQIPPDGWTPEPEPSGPTLAVDALSDIVRRPGAAIDTLRMGVYDVRATSRRLASAAGGLLSAARVVARPAPASPLNATIGPHRRFAVARTELDDYRRVRKQFGATVNDVVLGTVAGALREWLLLRGRPVTPSTSVRALVPVSIRQPTDDGERLTGNKISSYLIDLPVGEPSATIRLTQISYAMKAHKESGQSVGAKALIAVSGFTPPTVHALGARATGNISRRLFNLVVTNVPGPQFPLYAAGARLREMFPVVPLVTGQALGIGLTSYDGGVYYGLNADRESMSDVDTLAGLIEESLAELVAASDAPPPGRAIP